MPEYFETQKDRITFAEKMEYRFKQVEAADMCQRIISVIAGKYIELVLENHGRMPMRPSKRCHSPQLNTERVMYGLS